MNTENIRFIGTNGVKLPGIIWTPVYKPCMVVQIVHGMTEHIGCYEKFAALLTSCGIAVAGFDLRGHGLNKGDDECTSLGEKGWRNSLHDIYLFHWELNHRFPNIPLFMMGFSLGSFLVRDYLSRYSNRVSGAILMGTGSRPRMILSVRMAMVKKEIRKYGFNQSTPLVRKLALEIYNQKFSSNITPYDCFCSDEVQMHAYLADPMCCKSISAGLLWELLDAMRRTGSVRTYKRWRKETPVLLLSGAEDPVGDFGKGIQRVMQNMARGGLKDVRMQMIPNARHDLLHEKQSGGCDEAINVLTDWLFEHIRFQ